MKKFVNGIAGILILAVICGASYAVVCLPDYLDSVRMDAYDDGYSVAMENLEQEKQQSYDAGYNAGQEDASEKSYKRGYEEGYSTGRDDGYDEGYYDASVEYTSASSSRTSSAASSSSSSTTAVAPSTDNLPQGTTVYITKSGSKYHKSGCSYLRKSKIPISLSDAKSRGYSACSRCF